MLWFHSSRKSVYYDVYFVPVLNCPRTNILLGKNKISCSSLHGCADFCKKRETRCREVGNILILKLTPLGMFLTSNPAETKLINF